MDYKTVVHLYPGMKYFQVWLQNKLSIKAYMGSHAIQKHMIIIIAGITGINPFFFPSFISLDLIYQWLNEICQCTR